MYIPTKSHFLAWEKGVLDDCQLDTMAKFFAEMMAGAEALGPRYALATMALRLEHMAAQFMIISRRKEK